MDKLFHHDVTVVGDWTLALAALVACVFTGAFLARFLLNRLGRWASRTSFHFENMLLKSLPLPLYLLVLVGGINVAVEFAPLSGVQLQGVERVLRVLLLCAGVYVVDRMLQGLLQDMEKRHGDLRNSHFMLSAILRVAVWSLGAMVVLESLGVSITPLLASLGVGSLAVALALQSTLANLFSGLYLLIDKPVRVGQFVRLDTGEEGYVEMIGWRSTRIRLLANNTVVIPNSKLAENRILNYYLPEAECAVLVEVGVDYGSDLAKVEGVTVEVARDIQKTVEGAVGGFEPFIRYHTFADSSVNFTVILRAREFTANYLMKHEFIKRLHERYRREGIVLPFPQRTLEFRGTPSVEVASKGTGKP